ncbi:MAG: putative RND superfamily exporter protein [Planctomycetota bacterium]|jgi:predicted RND superfamily exporter protein
MRLLAFYNHLVYDRSRLVLFFIVLLTIFAAFQSLKFELDASSESLVLENDISLNYYRQTREDYGTDEYLLITYAPYTDLLSDESLAGLRSLRDQLLELENIEKVNSILDAPIIYNSKLKLSELTNKLKTLSEEDLDKDLARLEFSTNPFYRELLVSVDGNTTALQAIFKFDDVQFQLLNERKQLTDLATQRQLSQSESTELERVRAEIKTHNSQSLASQARDIETVRRIMDGERHRAKMYLGGIPMITADMIEFIRHDLVVFGVGVLAFLVLLLALFFRQARWVLLPLFCCAITAIIMLGFLGLAGWRITVISSNFMSILLIITLSLSVHLIVRFRDLQIENPQQAHKQIIRETMASMAKPCFFTIATTIVAFASLVVSNIRPVIDFGWVMIIGLIVAFIISFMLFPAALTLMKAANVPSKRDFTRNITLWVAQLVCRAPKTIIALCVLISLVVGIGMSRLKVENRFIDNFKSSTEIYQGMTVIDQELGGTTPLEIIIDPDSQFKQSPEPALEEEGELDDLFMDDEEGHIQASYWLNPTQMEIIQHIQDYLDANPVVGKVLSIGTVVRIAERLNGAELDAFELALVHKRIPNDIADDLIKPYLSEDTNQIRFSARVIESDHSLNRKQLLQDIRDFLVNEMHLEETQVHITGMLVLYNNMLQSLFRSQILTLVAVLLAIFLTFIVLFRNITLAVLGIIPNIFSAVMILGIMGWLRIPLDMMTITIASITIGIAVDDTIHYIHRLKHEYALNKDYETLVSRCHGSIGKAMYYTSVAIIFGFAILALSNFIPTINFGLMTGIAMFVALAGDLLLLPAMVLLVRPVIKT